MGTTKKKNSSTKLKSLNQGRPPLLQPQSTSHSSKATRTVIRRHHNILKAHAKAVQDGDTILAEKLSQQLTEKDLKIYQQASKTGQSSSRGGDSSKLLVDWLSPAIIQPSAEKTPNSQNVPSSPTYRVLEIGALSTRNAISCVPTMAMTRIDLHSQEKEILQQDFMERPLPKSEIERFHILSLSLVLNFVADPVGRGEMLKRCTRFFVSNTAIKYKDSDDENASSSSTTGKMETDLNQHQQQQQKKPLPSLFFVLPAPCVMNSRYLHESHLEDIMSSLGFQLLEKKITAKLYYSLWRYDASTVQKKVFKKKELVKGAGRNNFAIVL